MDGIVGDIRRVESESFVLRGYGLNLQVVEPTKLINATYYTRDDRLVGRAILVEIPEQYGFLLLDICVHDEIDRRVGFGTEIINLLKSELDFIYSEGKTKAGRELLLSCGFKFVPAMFKKERDIYVYSNGGKKCQRKSQKVMRKENQLEIGWLKRFLRWAYSVC